MLNQKQSPGIIIVLLILWYPAFITFSQDYSAPDDNTSNSLKVGMFSSLSPENEVPHGWEPLTFKKIRRHTEYSLVKEEGSVVVRADSQSSASGLIRKISVDPAEYPVIKWRWKVTTIYTNGDVTKKSGDDYPARLYITFEYDPEGLSFFEKAKYKAAKLVYGQYPPICALNYIWANKAPEGTIVSNAYTKKSMMIVLESGRARLNTWLEEERNIAEDFQKAFGKKPLMISGIAIMTDSDNTKESATAFYGDITLMKK